MQRKTDQTPSLAELSQLGGRALTLAIIEAARLASQAECAAMFEAVNEGQ